MRNFRKPAPLRGTALKEWLEFEQRKASEPVPTKAVAAPRKDVEVKTHRTGRFKVAKSFRAGHGRYS